LPLGCFAAAFGVGFLGITGNYLLILLLILLSGLGTAAFHPEAAKAAHFAAGGQRASAMSVFSVGGNFGFAFGSIIMAELLYLGGLSASLYLLVPGSLVALLLYSKIAQITYGEGTGEVKKKAGEAPAPSRFWPLVTLMTVVIIRSWVQSGLTFYIPFYYINYLKTDELYANTILFIFLLAGALGTIIGGPLSDRFGRKKLIFASMLLVPPLVLTFIYAESLLSMAALFVAGAVLVSTFSTTIVLGQEYLPNNVGIASGLMIGFAIGTGGIGVTLLGVLADATSEHVAMVATALLPLLGGLLAFFLPKESNA
jgi:FSR family fosmidomycin resistance protein-like MFS transporter